MGEFRQDRTTGAWTIVAPERNQRPHANLAGDGPAAPAAAYDPDCPFCPGNEAMLPRIIEEKAADAPSGWQTRVVPNKFPILATNAAEAGEDGALHEVIIETPRHDADLPDLTLAEMQTVVETWHRRFGAALAKRSTATALLFRNHGSAAGASLRHAHSQLVALQDVPSKQAAALSWARRHHERIGECVTCKELSLELEADRRVVELAEHFAVLVPFAAGDPLEQWIVPRRHTASFLGASGEERAALAAAIQRAFRRLEAVAGHAACNLVIEPGSNQPADEPYAHWAVRIVPNTTTPGGFEMLSGIRVNPSVPEHDADQLRDGRNVQV